MTEAIYYKKAAGVQTRYVVTGTLTLVRPTSLSNGDVEGLTDIALRRDAATGEPILPGTSLAGALRNYLWQRIGTANTGNLTRHLVDTLFGVNDQMKGTSQQSWLFIEDAYGQEVGVEIRDGVVIDPATRTAADKKKFDVEFLAGGTTFDLRLEFWVPAEGTLNPIALRQLLALALRGLERGEISLGGRKRRGFGECRVHNWQVHRYNMSEKADIVRWLEDDDQLAEQGSTLTEMLGLRGLPKLPQLARAHLKATFAVDTSLLIRAAPSNPKDPDQVHIRNADGDFILPGSSVAGALRARANRIAALILPSAAANSLINNLFGQTMDDENALPRAGRLWVREMPLRRDDLIANKVQSRVKIDRFTAGSYPGALFDQQPVWAGEVTLDLRLEQPLSAEIGLLLLLLKDLWTGTLSLGGETSVGRGRLKGIEALLDWNGERWQIAANDNGLAVKGNPDVLERTVKDLHKYAGKEEEDEK